MRIFLIRHADPHYPDDSLTPTGHREARALADHLAALDADALYASPRGRARLTAQYAADRLGLPVTVEPWTTELDGLYSEAHRHSLWDLDGALLRGPEVLADLNAWQSVPPLDNPNLAAHLARIQAGSDEFLGRMGFTRAGHLYHADPARRAPQRVALFAHLGFGLSWLALLLGIPAPLMWGGFFLYPSSVTTILFDERSPGMASPRVTGLGDVSHLYRAGLLPTPTGLIANVD